MNLEELLPFNRAHSSGFDVDTGNSAGRIINKDGSSNVQKTGLSFFKRLSVFHWLIELSTLRFFLLTLLVFILINLIFAGFYYILGPQALHDVSHDAGKHSFFLQCFFFSSQTLTTVGYGSLVPATTLSNLIASFESMFGWMTFAVMTGLIYSRFAQPKAYIQFSKNALISPYKMGKALMFRMTPFKNNQLTEAEVIVNVAFRISEQGRIVNHFYTLDTEISKISSLTLNWTIVHPIDEKSPLYGMCEEDFSINQIEVMVFVKAYDEHFSNNVQQRTSYCADEIVFNARFLPMFRQSDNKKTTLLEINKLNHIERL
ncbi:MAG: ion channel [Chitinophagaceae bacterium]